ncbi:MAG: hybrid sensor histidine kinase/response regulator [Rubrivivax sp.]|nr:hybrid sensor histidine kinase/response regulator [Rubrivivax sp.]
MSAVMGAAAGTAASAAASAAAGTAASTAAGTAACTAAAPRAVPGDGADAVPQQGDHRHDIDLRRLLFFQAQQRQLRWPILAAVVLVALLLAQHVPGPLLTAWVVLAVAVREWRSRLLGALVADAARPIGQRLNWLVVSNAALGCSHGLAAAFMPWLDTTSAALLTAVFLGWTGGAVATCAPLPRAYAGYAVGTLGPLALAWLLVDPSLFGLGVALLIGLTTGAQWRFLRLNARLFEESFRMRVENEDLVRQLAAARDVAEAGNHAKSRFLAAASHDLRQPLHALVLQVGLLEAGPGAAEVPETVREIGALTRSLARLLDSLLDISKLDAGVVVVDQRALLLHRLLERLVRNHQPQALARGLALRLDCPLQATVTSDPLLLERVLRNLVDNALKYTERGEVAVVATIDGEDRFATVTVRDSGRGIPAAARERVFEEFFRAEADGNTPRESGLGLGLAIVRRLATLLQMPLELDSEPGRGTTVTLRLPLAPGHADAGRAGRPRALAATGAAGEGEVPGGGPGGLRGRRVLLLDDEPAVRRAVRHVLAHFGCRVAEAGSSEEALAQVASFAPELLLADWRLRDGDSGLAAVHRLRQRVPGLPAILVSGDTDDALRREAAAAGLALLSKPVTLAVLAEAMASALAPMNR